MILQSLVSYYESLVASGILSEQGWSPVKVSYALEIDDSGELLGVISLKQQVQKGKKTVIVPQEIALPTPVKRTAGVNPNFLCDNSSYILGIDDKGKADRTKKCFDECKMLHEKMLADLSSRPAKALVSFFEKWSPEKLEDVVTEKDVIDDIISGANLIFIHESTYVHEDSEIRSAWNNRKVGDEDKEYPCLITGRRGPLARLHPSIKGIMGAQSSGASLVSFNAPAFCSYGSDQGMNAPSSEYAAFAYGEALNYLISTQKTRIGDTTVLFWSDRGGESYRAAMDWIGFGGSPSDSYTDDDLKNFVETISEGKPFEFNEELIDPDMEFCILGISPNAARLSVRFFYRNSFGSFVRNIREHYKRLEINKPAYERFEMIPLWKMLQETVNQNSRDKTPSPTMAADTLQAVLSDTRYPATLLNGINLRIRADREINYTRAAILKAYYSKNENIDVPKEVLTVSLNHDSTNVAYTLGRIFSVLENIQDSANPGINSTIRDKYFSSASATPAAVFPTLVNLAQKHVGKLETGKAKFFEKQLGELFGKLECEEYPANLNIPQQGSFQLGYYHQTQYRYTKKEDK